MRSTTSAKPITVAKSKPGPFEWIITDSEYLNFDSTIYSSPFKAGNVGWQTVFKGVGQDAKCGLKFLGCSVLGPCFPITVEYSCSMFGGKHIFNKVLRVFSSTNDEQCEDIAENIGLVSYVQGAHRGLHLIFNITYPLGNFIIPLGSLSQDLSPYAKNPLLTNVKFIIGNPPTTMKAHKEILKSRSPVFAAMFNSDTVENKQNSIRIGDIKPKVFKQLLNYIYTDKADIGEISPASLLAAADKYDLKRLKVACEHAIFRGTNVSTAIDDLILADMHNAKELKSHLLQTVVDHAGSLMGYDGWEALSKHPKLLLEVHTAISKK